MRIPLRQEFNPDLENKGGWLSFFLFFSVLSVLAFFRSAAATVVSGRGEGLTLLAIAIFLLVAVIGLVLRKRWAYYLMVFIGVFLLLYTAMLIFMAPGLAMVRDWAFDVPPLFEWMIVAGWLGYFLYSRRVYSFLFAPAEIAPLT
jgi:hypothetical protein